MFGLLRKFVLLMLLFFVAMSAYLSASGATRWKQPLWVQVYPINSDGSAVTRRYIERLQRDDFTAIESFMQAEAARYGVAINEPVRVFLSPELNDEPPLPPWDSNFVRIGWWSLQLRWWAYEATRGDEGPRPDIRLFLRYHDPQQQPVLAHSLGLQKGRLGIVNLFASRSQAATNNFVIAHEMLHTIGATDKYAGADHLPAFPDGYADPERVPLYPQSRAEIMGGRIPLSADSAAIPASLREVSVGAATAREIRWLQD